MTMNKKRILKVLLVILLLIACIPFAPPIYNRFTKPLYKNYIDAKLWYDKVDCEELLFTPIDTHFLRVYGRSRFLEYCATLQIVAGCSDKCRYFCRYFSGRCDNRGEQVRAEYYTLYTTTI